MKSKIKELPATIVAIVPHNSNGFITISGVNFLYNKVLKMYMRSDVVKKYRKLRKKYSPSTCLVKTVLT